MKTYYSIVSISPNPALNEKFNVGLLCVASNHTYFHFSQAKLKIVSKLLSANAAKLVLTALEGIDSKINAKAEEKSLLFAQEGLSMVAEPYINYLHRYNNNLVQFTPTTEIDIEMSQSVFEQLFRKYIYSDEIFTTHEILKAPNFTNVRNHFKRLAQPYANTNFPVTNEVIPDLVVPVTVDVFGKNGAFVTGHATDFQKQFNFLQNDLSTYLYLVEHAKRTDSDSTCFLLANEPSKQAKPNHDLWTSIRKSGLIKLVPVDESERIIEFMKDKGVQPVK